MTIFKAELIFTLYQEFMANIKPRPMIKKGKKKLISWIRGKKLRVSPDTFAEIFEIPKVEFSDIGMLDLSTVSHELLWGGGG